MQITLTGQTIINAAGVLGGFLALFHQLDGKGKSKDPGDQCVFQHLAGFRLHFFDVEAHVFLHSLQPSH